MLDKGPDRLCQALGITATFDAMPLESQPFTLRLPEERVSVVVGMRIALVAPSMFHGASECAIRRTSIVRIAEKVTGS